MTEQAYSIPLPGDHRFDLAAVNVFVGHYGVGKTNLSLNVAYDAAHAGYSVTLVDLDVINPYFRSSEYRVPLEEAGIRLIAPVFAEAGTSLDVPTLTGAIAPAIEHAFCTNGHIVIVDAGGDEMGATTLGCFARIIETGDSKVFYVVNPFRNLTRQPHSAIEILRDIEAQSRIEVTSIISNAHLKGATDMSCIERGINFARAVSDETTIPFTCATVPKFLLCREKELLTILESDLNLYPITTYVKTPWE